MSRRANVASRCAECRMHESLCLCAIVPRIETRTRLVLFLHRAEERKPTNTGRLATRCLVNSEVMVRGDREAAATPFVTPPGTRPLLLFPHEDAPLLSSFVPDGRPITLLVPDGNWRQASKVRNRVPGLRDVPCVSLPAGAPSTYRLRAEAHPNGMATLEAIARVLRVLEGEERGPDVERALLHVFDAMVERTLWARGQMGTEEVTGGVPAGASRHDPRSGVIARDGERR